MTHPSSPDTPTRSLPLTEPAVAEGRSAIQGLVSGADIRALVDSFYDTVRGDDLLGPVFARRVSDWSVHLPRMYDFWSAVVLHSGRYSGRPIEVHQAIVDLSPAHFARWLVLWETAVERVIAPPARAAFVLAARRMAASMSARLAGRGGSGAMAPWAHPAPETGAAL